MTHTYVGKNNTTIYRYYVCINAHQRGWNKCDTRSVSAPLLEGAVVEQIRRFARRPEMLADVLQRIEGSRQANPDGSHRVGIADPGEIQELLAKFAPLWEQLTKREQERFIRALVAEVRYDGRTQTVTLAFRSETVKHSCRSDAPEVITQ